MNLVRCEGIGGGGEHCFCGGNLSPCCHCAKYEWQVAKPLVPEFNDDGSDENISYVTE